MAEKKRFRVIGVPLGTKLTTYTKKFEEALNQLSEDGYVIRMMESGKRGVVVVGELQQEQPSSPLNFLRALGIAPIPTTPASVGVAPPASPVEHAETKRVRGMIVACGNAVPDEKLEEELTKLLTAVSKRLTAVDCVQIADDLVRGAEAHEAADHDRKECELSKLFRQSAAVLRNIVQPRVN